MREPDFPELETAPSSAAAWLVFSTTFEKTSDLAKSTRQSEYAEPLLRITSQRGSSH
jgi:hypothetical protein